MKATLTLNQAVQFLAGVWNNSSIKSWGESTTEFLKGIAATEATRTFNPGWNFCDSKLEIAPNGYSWYYCTTSGTKLFVTGSMWKEDGNLSEPQIVVEIPEHRNGGNHAAWLQKCLSGAVFFEWGQLYYSSPGTPEYDEAIKQGMTPKCDKPVRVPTTKTEEDDWEDYEGSEDEYEYDEEELIEA